MNLSHRKEAGKLLDVTLQGSKPCPHWTLAQQTKGQREISCSIGLSFCPEDENLTCFTQITRWQFSTSSFRPLIPWGDIHSHLEELLIFRAESLMLQSLASTLPTFGTADYPFLLQSGIWGLKSPLRFLSLHFWPLLRPRWQPLLHDNPCLMLLTQSISWSVFHPREQVFFRQIPPLLSRKVTVWSRKLTNPQWRLWWSYPIKQETEHRLRKLRK
jgi:hypothetical protein